MNYFFAVTPYNDGRIVLQIQLNQRKKASDDEIKCLKRLAAMIKMGAEIANVVENIDDKDANSINAAFIFKKKE
jgi:hypothetical protein